MITDNSILGYATSVTSELSDHKFVRTILGRRLPTPRVSGRRNILVELPSGSCSVQCEKNPLLSGVKNHPISAFVATSMAFVGSGCACTIFLGFWNLESLFVETSYFSNRTLKIQASGNYF